jgi:DNA-binding LytR/AlgR family response regulator
MLTAIAIDDEPVALEILQKLAENLSFLQITACFTDAFEAIDYLQNNKTNLIFLDIKMPDISGIDFLKSLPSPPLIIFTTAYSEHAVQSFELDAIDYLLKPFAFSRFLKACNKAYELYELKRRTLAESPDRPSFFIKSGYDQVRINTSDILYIESLENYVQFVLSGRTIVSRMTMHEAVAILPASAFIRIHRSFLVAKNQVTKIEKKSVWVNNKELPVSETYQSEILKFIKL